MTFAIKVRGAPTATIAAEYYCEEHGRFELDVERTAAGDAPDAVPCPFTVEVAQLHPDTGEYLVEMSCGLPAIWCISAPLARVRKIEAVKGKSQKPERETWTDTRSLGEGQPLYEWKEDRAKVWEEWRKKDVMRFAKEHHERPIGGD